MKRIYYFIFLIFSVQSYLYAQNTFEEYKKQKEQAFKNYQTEKQRKFNEYRQKKNLEFAKYIANKWETMQVFKGKATKILPKPINPIVAPDTPTPDFDIAEIPIKDIIPAEPTPIPDNPVKLPPIQEKEPLNTKTRIIFLGTPCYVELDNQLKFSLKGTSEKEISRIFNQLSDSKYDNLFRDCARIYQDMHLNGWATLLLCQTISEKLLGKSNEAIVLQTYLLTQFGYDARMCCYKNRLYLMTTTTEDISRYYYLKLDNNKPYYIWDLSYKGEQVNTYRNNMKDAVCPIDFDNPTEMRLSYVPTNSKQITSARYPSATASVKVNKNLINYYTKMPTFSGKPWNIYARQALETPCYRELIPQLQKAIQNKTETEAANILLNWVQTGFEYKTDNEQFGFEKPFFKEEVIYYPYSDCEDRSILFSYLIKQMLHLDVVLLYFPGHLATAVRFNNTVKGDYVQVNGEKYIICDPTFVGAEIGRCMPNFKTVSFDVIEIN